MKGELKWLVILLCLVCSSCAVNISNAYVPVKCYDDEEFVNIDSRYAVKQKKETNFLLPGNEERRLMRKLRKQSRKARK